MTLTKTISTTTTTTTTIVSDDDHNDGDNDDNGNSDDDDTDNEDTLYLKTDVIKVRCEHKKAFNYFEQMVSVGFDSNFSTILDSLS